jgi:hypothetical protein
MPEDCFEAFGRNSSRVGEVYFVMAGVRDLEDGFVGIHP